MTECFPELQFLGKLEPGTVLDGEVVVLRKGKPDFGLLLSRLGSRCRRRRHRPEQQRPGTGSSG